MSVFRDYKFIKIPVGVAVHAGSLNNVNYLAVDIKQRILPLYFCVNNVLYSIDGAGTNFNTNISFDISEGQDVALTSPLFQLYLNHAFINTGDLCSRMDLRRLMIDPDRYYSEFFQDGWDALPIELIGIIE